MEEELQLIIEDADEQMSNSLIHLQKEFGKLRTGKASPQMLEGVMVDYYGTKTPLQQVANVSVIDAKTIFIQPWEKPMLETIEKEILNANLGFTPQNNGEVVIINIPALTEERRKDIVKKAKNEGEQAKIAVRNVRRDANDAIKKLQKDGLAEDNAKGGEDDIQKLTDAKIKEIDELLDAKEKEIMTI